MCSGIVLIVQRDAHAVRDRRYIAKVIVCSGYHVGRVVAVQGNTTTPLDNPSHGVVGEGRGRVDIVRFVNESANTVCYCAGAARALIVHVRSNWRRAIIVGPVGEAVQGVIRVGCRYGGGSLLVGSGRNSLNNISIGVIRIRRSHNRRRSRYCVRFGVRRTGEPRQRVVDECAWIQATPGSPELDCPARRTGMSLGIPSLKCPGRRMWENLRFHSSTLYC